MYLFTESRDTTTAENGNGWQKVWQDFEDLQAVHWDTQTESAEDWGVPG